MFSEVYKTLGTWTLPSNFTFLSSLSTFLPMFLFLLVCFCLFLVFSPRLVFHLNSGSIQHACNTYSSLWTFLSSLFCPHLLPLLLFFLFYHSFCTRFTSIFFFFNSGSPPSTHLPFLLCPFPLLLLSSLLVLFFFLSYFHLFLCFFLFREYTSCLQYVFSLILSFHSLSSPSFPPTVPFSLYYFHLIFFNPGDLHHVTSSPNFSLLFSLSSPPAPLPPLCILSAILFSPFLLFSAGLKLVDCGRQVN